MILDQWRSLSIYIIVFIRKWKIVCITRDFKCCQSGRFNWFSALFYAALLRFLSFCAFNRRLFTVIFEFLIITKTIFSMDSFINSWLDLNSLYTVIPFLWSSQFNLGRVWKRYLFIRVYSSFWVILERLAYFPVVLTIVLECFIRFVCYWLLSSFSFLFNFIFIFVSHLHVETSKCLRTLWSNLILEDIKYTWKLLLLGLDCLLNKFGF